MNYDNSGNYTTISSKSKRRTSKFVKLLLLLIFCFTIFLFTPFFDLSKIEVIGNNKISAEKIIQFSGLNTGENIFKYRLAKVEENIKTLPYISTVSAYRVLPSTIRLEVSEATPIACLKFLGGVYGIIDFQGKILETQSKRDTDIMYVSGISFNTVFEQGKTIYSENENYKVLLEFLDKVKFKDFKIKSVDVSNVNNIHLEIRDNLTASLGGVNNLEYKIIFLKEAVSRLSLLDKGNFVFVADDRLVFSRTYN